MTPHEASFRFYTRLRGRRRLSAVELQLRCVPPCVGRRSAGEVRELRRASRSQRAGAMLAPVRSHQCVTRSAPANHRHACLASARLARQSDCGGGSHRRRSRSDRRTADAAGARSVRAVRHGRYAVDTGGQFDLQRAGGRCGGASPDSRRHRFRLAGRHRGGAVHRARQGAALSRRRQSGAGSRDRGQCRHRAARRGSAARVHSRAPPS